jgi:putative ATPase
MPGVHTEALTEDDLLKLIKQALTKDADLKKREIVIKEHQALLNISGGDARKLLNLILS